MNWKFAFTYFILFLILIPEVNAQKNFRFGGYLGSSFSRYILLKQSSSIDQWEIGYYTYAFCRLPLKNNFWLETGVGLTDFGNRVEYRTDSLYQLFRESRHFIQFTELVGHTFYLNSSKSTKLNIEAGPFFGYYIFSHQYWKTENLFNHMTTVHKYYRNICRDDPNIRKYIVGIAIGTGISKSLQGAEILFDFRYNLSLSRISKYKDNPEFPYSNRNYYQLYSISMGYMF